MRSPTVSRSHCATETNRCSIKRPTAFEVSKCSVTDANSMSLSFSVSRTVPKSLTLRTSRSSFHTTTAPHSRLRIMVNNSTMPGRSKSPADTPSSRMMRRRVQSRTSQ